MDFHKIAAPPGHTVLAVGFQGIDGSAIGRPLELMRAAHKSGVPAVSFCFDEINDQSMIAQLADVGPELWLELTDPGRYDSAELIKQPVSGFKFKLAEISDQVIQSWLCQLNGKLIIDAMGSSLIDMFEFFDRAEVPADMLLLHDNFSSTALSGNSQVGITGFSEAQDGDPLGSLKSAFPEFSIGYCGALASGRFAAAPLKFGMIYSDEYTKTGQGGQPTQISALLKVIGSSPTVVKKNVEPPQIVLKALLDLNADNLLNDATLHSGLYVGAGMFSRPHRLKGRNLKGSVLAGQIIREADLSQNVGVFLQSRVASTRLPQKALLPFYDGLSTIEYLIKRLLSYSGEIGQVVLATTQRTEDDALQSIANAMGVPCLRGADADVLGRMVQVADEFGWDVLVRATGDDPFISCEYIEKAVAFHLEHSADYTQCRGLPIGMNCEVLDVRTLRRMHSALVDKRHGEFVTWFFDSLRLCRYQILQADTTGQNCGHYRVTLDYDEDYDLMREVARRCHEGVADFYVSTDRVIDILCDIDPKWLHNDDLFPIRREEVGIELRFDSPRTEPNSH